MADEPKPLALSIAGSDSSGGAGLQADLRAFAALGVHGASVLTAITVQSPAAVESVHLLPARVVAAQLASVTRHLPPAAVKIGMLGSSEIAEELIQVFKDHRFPSVVCDPVLASSSGNRLLDERGLSALKTGLFPHVDLLTPNLPETERLVEKKLETPDSIEAAAEQLREGSVKAVLVKGGHRLSDFSSDFFTDGRTRFWLTSPRRQGRQTRGTGCTLSAAIAALRARGFAWHDALVGAKCFLNQGLRKATLFGETHALLATTSWPQEAVPEDMPRLCARIDEAENPLPAFPSCGDRPLGFYPIVPRAEWVRRLIPLGVTTLQLRIKDLRGEALAREIKEAIAIARPHACRLFINDHWELALASGAYGVHLGQEDLQSADQRRLAASGLRLGISTHCHAEVARASVWRPSYTALGPIFPTTCKSMRYGPHGLEELRGWRHLIRGPLVAIGGLKLEHLPALRETGADGFAVISDLTESPDPVGRAKQWLEAREGLVVQAPTTDYHG